MYASTWTPTKNGFEAVKDGRYGRIRCVDGRWCWYVAYEGETALIEGKADTAKAAKSAAGRHLM